MANILRVSIVGTMPSGEEWSVNPVWSLGDFPVSTTPSQIFTVVNAVAGVNMPAGLLSSFAPTTVFTGAKVEARTYAGVLENQAEAIRLTPQPGTGAVVHPFQVAWVSSLRTTFVGASGRGRLYWPSNGVTLSTSVLRPTTPTPATFNTAVAQYLGLVQTAIKATYPAAALAVWSRKLLDAHIVTTIQAGDVLDVQRRRRDNLVEAYVTTTFP
jgi:hypothetical protein